MSLMFTCMSKIDLLVTTCVSLATPILKTAVLVLYLWFYMPQLFTRSARSRFDYLTTTNKWKQQWR